MNIILIGYMASGKSTIGSLLASKLNFNFVDFDNYIEDKEYTSIKEIFANKGEIYFRKKETIYLNEILKNFDHSVISLGGGTPCYGNNLDTLLSDNNSVLIYLNTSVSKLSERLLQEKEMRPLINHLQDIYEMKEYVGKHLFERQFYYNQAQVVIQTEIKSKDEIVESIIATLF